MVFIETVFCSIGSIIKPLKLTGWECYQVRITEPHLLQKKIKQILDKKIFLHDSRAIICRLKRKSR